MGLSAPTTNADRWLAAGELLCGAFRSDRLAAEFVQRTDCPFGLEHVDAAARRMAAMHDAIKELESLAPQIAVEFPAVASCAFLAVGGLKRVGDAATPFDWSAAREFHERIEELVKTWLAVAAGAQPPSQCAVCARSFFSCHPGQRTCHDCRFGLGTVGEILVALMGYWNYNLPARIPNRADWNDFSDAFYNRFDVFLEDAADGWCCDPNLEPSENLPPAWKSFERHLRTHLVANGAKHEQWRDALSKLPIADAVRLMEADAPAAAGDGGSEAGGGTRPT
jgi:hypothetical protein